MQSNNRAASYSDEIDLLELFKALWQQKWLIIATTVVVTLAAAIYAFLSVPVYESKYYISPPTLDDIANLNYGRTRDSGLSAFTVDDVYKVFLRNLQSESLRRSFFEKIYLPVLSGSTGQQPHGSLYEDFSKAVTITSVDKDAVGRWSVSFQNFSPKNAAEWVSLYVKQAGQSAEREVIRNATKEASVRARNLQLQIDSLRESGKKIRQDSISQLREALAIAKASGLENSVVFTGAGSPKLAGNMADDFAYMRGSKALEAELKNLESRESNDPFIPGLRKLQNEYNFYKGLEEGEYDIAVFRQDGIVEQPIAPIKPKKLLILVLGVVLGSLLGAALALTRYFILKRRQTDVPDISLL